MNGLEAVHEALRHMRREGVDRVFVSDAALESLRAAAPEKPAPEPAKLEIPVEPAARASAPKPAKPAPAPRTPPLPPPPAEPEPPAGTAAERLAWLEDTVLNCPTCREHLSKHGKIVFGAGSAEADIFFCGEAPGADEERSGEPFVGKAGQLLTKIIEAMGLRRGEVYIANILKWRPEHDKPYGNRPPTREEMEFCLPYLRAQLNIIRPKVIVALGNTAVTGLLGPDPERRMGQVRGTWQSFNNTPLMITFHPSYLLRNNTLKTKRQVWEDLLQVMDKVGLPISEKQQGFFLPKG
ncbi:MAG: uracil-DNA glycosylase [Verrucomicrobiota bacterium]